MVSGLGLCVKEKVPLLLHGQKPVPGLRGWQAKQELDISLRLPLGQLSCAMYKSRNCPEPFWKKLLKYLCEFGSGKARELEGFRINQ